MRNLLLLLTFLMCVLDLPGQVSYTEMSHSEKKLYDEHVYLGQVDDSKVYVRQAFVFKYNPKYRIPEWAAYHIVRSYLETPDRTNKYKTFRKDKAVPNPVVTDDYTGSGYARGHLVPYFALGGDRDGNGVKSDLFESSADPYDDVTIFQGNSMTNITPQNHASLNGAGAPWYDLETVIRTKLVPKLGELYLVVGGIVSDSIHYEEVMHRMTKPTGIAVPDKFYQVIIYFDAIEKQHISAAFLFPHFKNKEDLPSKDAIDYLVPVDSVEGLTGLDFFSGLPDAEEHSIESESNKEFWNKWF